MVRYIHYKGNSVARINKNAATAICTAVLDKLDVRIRAPKNFEIKSPKVKLYMIGAMSGTPVGTVHALIRDPVDRFKSACAQLEVSDIDDQLDALESLEPHGWDIHFSRQSLSCGNGTRLYLFEKHLQDLAVDFGLGEIPEIIPQGGFNPKPTLTTEQEIRVRELYAEDIKLHASITQPGQVYETPLEEGEKIEKIRKLKNQRYLEEVSGFTISGTNTDLDGVFIRTDREVSQVKITQGAIAATMNPSYATEWQFADGTVAPLDAEKIKTIFSSFNDFEQGGRTKLKTLIEAVKRADTRDELKAIKW